MTDGRALYCAVRHRRCCRLDFLGKPLWIRSGLRNMVHFAIASMAASPILVNDMLVILVDHWGQSYLLAIDPKRKQLLEDESGRFS